MALMRFHVEVRCAHDVQDLLNAIDHVRDFTRHGLSAARTKKKVAAMTSREALQHQYHLRVIAEAFRDLGKAPCELEGDVRDNTGPRGG